MIRYVISADAVEAMLQTGRKIEIGSVSVDSRRNTRHMAGYMTTAIKEAIAPEWWHVAYKRKAPTGGQSTNRRQSICRWRQSGV